MLIEIHILQNHSPSNLNRDDTGSPKSCVFGDIKRARISSQCLKRAIRRSDIFQNALKGHLATRTRRLPELVRDRLLQAGMSPEMAEIAALKASGFGKKEQKEKDRDERAQTTFDTAQTMFLAECDIQAVTDLLLQEAKTAGTPEKFKEIKAADLQKNELLRGYRPITVDIALFGRMTTSDAFRDAEAAAQVAHAISTHKVDADFDYFTAVDDLQGSSDLEEDAGADMIGDVEFNSACYYKYFAIDLDGLKANLTGERLGNRQVSEEDRQQAKELAIQTIIALIRAAVTVTPTGKQNSFAAHQMPSLVLIELRPHRTPVNYANAFVKPATGKGLNDLVFDSLQKLKTHVEAITRGFDLQTKKRWLLAPEYPEYEIEGVTRVDQLNNLLEKLREVISDG